MIAITVLAAQFAGTLDLSDTTRIGARANQPVPTVNLSSGGQGKDYIAADFSTAPGARLRFNDRHWDYSLSYAPTVTAGNLEFQFAPQVLQIGAATVGWHDRFLSVTVSESASYGRVSSGLFTTLGGGAAGQAVMSPSGSMTTPAMGPTTTPATGPTTMTPGMQSAPGAQSQAQPANNLTDSEFGSTSTLGNVSLRTDPRTVFSLSGGYLVSGGLNTAAKLSFPNAYGPLATLSVGYALAQHDSFTLSALGQETTTSGVCPPPQPVPPALCVERAPVVQLQGTFHHPLSGSTNLNLGAGVAGYIIQTPTLEEAVIQPVGSATLSGRLSPGGLSRWALIGALAPNVDIRTGLVSDRVQTTASLSELVAHNVTFVVTTGALRSLPFPKSDPFPLTSVSGGVEAQVRADRLVEVDLGLQEVWQNQTGYGTLALTVGYVSVTARMQTLNF